MKEIARALTAYFDNNDYRSISRSYITISLESVKSSAALSTAISDCGSKPFFHCSFF
jgi:hypothetical protein